MTVHVLMMIIILTIGHCVQVEANLQEKETYRKELTLAKEKVEHENDENGDVGNGDVSDEYDTCKGEGGQ